MSEMVLAEAEPEAEPQLVFVLRKSECWEGNGCQRSLGLDIRRDDLAGDSEHCAGTPPGATGCLHVHGLAFPFFC